MKTSLLKLGGAFSFVMTSLLVTACSGGDMGKLAAADEEGGASEEASQQIELGSVEQAIHSCANPDGTNAVMAAFAVSVAQELGRWEAGLDFEAYGTNGQFEGQTGTWSSAIRLTSGTGADGKPRGKSRCSDGKCAKTAALLSMQYDTAAGKVYVQAENSTTKVLLDPNSLRSRMSAKLQEQKNKDRDARNADLNQGPKTAHTLTKVPAPAGVANLGGCGAHHKFTVGFAAVPVTNPITPNPLPAQLKWKLSFADQQNGWVDFRDLGGNVVAIDPTYGLNEGDTSTAGSCEVACTKVSPNSNVNDKCCSCGGVSKKFKVSTFNTAVYLCQ